MNATITEYNRQLETMRRNNARAQQQTNKVVGYVALVIVLTIGLIYSLNATGVIHLSY